MTKDAKPQATRADHRKSRLADQLRANLQKRKEQSRARRAGDADGREDGLQAAEKKQKS